jgi:hypothetical protein
VQRVRDPVPEEEAGGARPGREQERQRGPAEGEEEAQAREGAARGGGGEGGPGAPLRGVRQGRGAQAAAADAAEETPRRGGARRLPAHGPLLRRRLRLTRLPTQQRRHQICLTCMRRGMRPSLLPRFPWNYYA